MTIKRFEIRRDTKEILVRDISSLTPDGVLDAYMMQAVQEPQILESFDDLESARTAFAKISPEHSMAFHYAGRDYLKAALLWIEENDYELDEDDGGLNWIAGGETYDVKADLPDSFN